MRYTDGVMSHLLRDLGTNLEIALAEYKDADDKLSAARSEEIAALNKLNSAQKALDDFVAKMKKEAPRQSDWKTAERAQQGIEIK